MTTTTEIVMDDAQTQTHPSTLPPMAMDIDRLTFPRDFKIPEGVVIIPFKDFKERGICIDPGPNEDEVDTIGVPTIAMRRHDADRCKTNTRRKQKNEEAKKRKTLGNSSPWWERWEEDEESRIAKPTNATDSKVQKFLSVASDFKNGRAWPTGVNQQVDPNYIWTRLEMFLGITGTKVGKSGKKKQSKAFLQTDPDPVSDDSGDEDAELSGEEFITGKDKKTLRFIRDPETATKIFLSSFARSKGIIWRVKPLELPLLMKFFLEFLVRSRVFKDSETGFRLAVQVCTQALEELPLGFQLSAELCPEPFGQACRLVFGPKAEGFRIFKWDDDPDANSLKFNPPPGLEESDQDGPEIELLSSESGANHATSGGWGNTDVTSGSWGGSWGTENAWEPTPATNDPDAVQWGAPEEDPEAKADEEKVVQQWLKEDIPKPIANLPSALAATHTTGIVERSLRKITNLIPIPANLPPAANPAKDAPPDPAEVEAQLERSFPKVVLSPWLDWDGGEMPVYSEPNILETSQGPVVEAPYKTRPDGEEPPKLAPGQVKKHDPGNDDITILVEPAIFEKLQNAKGMSAAGTWVQIVRHPKVEVEEAGAAKKKKKSKKKANLWYLDDLAGIFPSFWSVEA